VLLTSGATFRDTQHSTTTRQNGGKKLNPPYSISLEEMYYNVGIGCSAGFDNAIFKDKHGISISTDHGKREKVIYANYRPSGVYFIALI
jgi:hypothetical protein